MAEPQAREARPLDVIGASNDAGTLSRTVTITGGYRMTVRKLIEELAAEQRRSAALAVDAGRRERRAAEAAMDCQEHGREIRYLRHMASWCWDGEQQAEAARQGIVRMLIVAARGLEGRTDPVPAEVVARELLKAIDGQEKARRRPRSPFADCLHASDCGHDGLSDALKAEIARILGIVPPEGGQGVLFAASEEAATVAAQEGEG